MWSDMCIDTRSLGSNRLCRDNLRSIKACTATQQVIQRNVTSATLRDNTIEQGCAKNIKDTSLAITRFTLAVTRQSLPLSNVSRVSANWPCLVLGTRSMNCPGPQNLRLMKIVRFLFDLPANLTKPSAAISQAIFRCSLRTSKG